MNDSPNPELDQSVNEVMFLLAYTGDTKRVGRYMADERSNLIRALGVLTKKLWADASRSEVPSEPGEQTDLAERRGIVGGGSIS